MLQRFLYHHHSRITKKVALTPPSSSCFPTPLVRSLIPPASLLLSTPTSSFSTVHTSPLRGQIETGADEWNKAEYANEEFDWGTYTSAHCQQALEFLQVPSSATLVVDIGSGSGAFALLAAEEFTKRRMQTTVLATDFAKGMVQVLERNVKEKQLTNVLAKVMDAHDLRDIRSNSADIIACVFAVVFFKNRPKCYSEMIRVLKPGGKISIIVWEDSQFLSIAEEVSSRVGGNRVFDDTMFVKYEQLKDDLETAGFRDIEIHGCTPYFKPSDPKAMVAGFLNSPLLIEKFKDVPNIHEITEEVFLKQSEKPWINKSLIAIARKY